MNKYSDIEIQTAKNLLKEGYKWIRKSRLGAILAYGDKPTKNPERFIPGKTVCADYVPIFTSIKFGDDPTSLETVAHPPILDDAEKRYLENVIRPFREDAFFIMKHHRSLRGFEQIVIGYKSDLLKDRFYLCLPPFKEGSMYEGMESDLKYGLEELGL